MVFSKGLITGIFIASSSLTASVMFFCNTSIFISTCGPSQSGSSFLLISLYWGVKLQYSSWPSITVLIPHLRSSIAITLAVSDLPLPDSPATERIYRDGLVFIFSNKSETIIWTTFLCCCSCVLLSASITRSYNFDLYFL